MTANAVSAAEAAAIPPDGEVQEEVLLLKAAQAREEAIRLADAGDYDSAQQVTRDVAKRLRLAGLNTEADALDANAPALSAPLYSPAERKRMWFEQHQARRRRQ